MELTPKGIARQLAAVQQTKRPPESPYPKGLHLNAPTPAAVLLPLLKIEQNWHVLFIRRALHPHDRHGGQVAFPGGRCDPGDASLEAAALREAHEEINLHPRDVQLLGRLPDLLTITNYRVTPVVGVMPWPYAARPQPEEVSRIFTIPLDWLADPANRATRKREIQHQGEPIPVIYFAEYEGETLWGASARMMVVFLETLGLASPAGRYA